MPKHPSHHFCEDVLPLQRNYLRRIAGYIGDIRHLNEMVRKDSFPVYDLHRMLRLSHNLIGSGATYGFPAISVAAQELNSVLERFSGAEADHASKGRQEAELLEKLFGFEAACTEAINGQSIVDGSKNKISRLRLVPNWMAEKIVYLVSKTPGPLEALSVRLRQYGYTPKSSLLSDLSEDLHKGFFHALIQYSDNPERDLISISAFGAPFIVVSPDNRLEARLAAIRAGAHAYLPVSIEPAEIIKKIDDITLHEMRPIQTLHVLIAYNDAVEAEIYASALQAVGYEVTIATTAHAAFRAVEQQTFDLVIIGPVFTLCTGSELAVVIRQGSSLKDQPILLIAEPNQIHGEVPTGAILIKPFIPQQLASLIGLLTTKSK